MANNPDPTVGVGSAGYRAPDRTRTSWPELVGYPDFHAANLVCYDRSDVHVDFYDVGVTQPGDTDPERAVVHRDVHSIVVYPPYIS